MPAIAAPPAPAPPPPPRLPPPEVRDLLPPPEDRERPPPPDERNRPPPDLLPPPEVRTLLRPLLAPPPVEPPLLRGDHQVHRDPVDLRRGESVVYRTGGGVGRWVGAGLRVTLVRAAAGSKTGTGLSTPKRKPK